MSHYPIGNYITNHIAIESRVGSMASMTGIDKEY